jgi:hypothetical protein
MKFFFETLAVGALQVWLGAMLTYATIRFIQWVESK